MELEVKPQELTLTNPLSIEYGWRVIDVTSCRRWGEYYVTLCWRGVEVTSCQRVCRGDIVSVRS